MILDIFTRIIATIHKLIKSIMLLDDAFAAVIVNAGNFFGLIDDNKAEKSLSNLTDQWDEIWSNTRKAKDELQSYKDKTGGGGKGSILPKSTFDEAESNAKSTMDNISNIFKDGIKDSIKDFKSFGDIAKNTIAKIGDSILNNQIDQIFSAAGGNNVGSLFSNMGSGSGNNMMGSLGSMFGGFFAEGGMYNAGKPIIVGEKGPEMILPKSGGQVVPNNQLGNMGATSVVLNINGVTDANSFRKSQGQITAEAARAIDIARRRNT
jgi:hypothetical protein